MRIAAVALAVATQGGGRVSALDFPLHFLRPWCWLALVPLPLALWALARGGGGRAALARLADAVLLPHLIHDSGARQHYALGLVGLAWLLAVAALSGPAWQKVATPLYVNGAARVVALSLSDDMLAQDMHPDRMAHARFAVHDLLDAAGDARTALVAYAGAAFTVAPLTDDKRTVLNLLRALAPDVMPAPGNDAAAGIRRSVELLENAHVKGGEIVLVTDTAGDAAVAAARAARAKDIRVDVLGIGTTAGAPVPQNGGGFANGAHGMLMARRDDAALRAVASAGGGRYSILQADGGGVAALGAPVAESGHASRGERAQLWRDGGVWLLPALLVLAALAFRRGWLLVLTLLVLPIGMPVAHAANLDSWFANRDQRALQALRQGDAAKARQLATTPALQGAADYRAGDYPAAAKAFAQGRDARAHYNFGNALAKQGDYAKAVDAYKQALAQDPKLADARANLAAVEDWLKKHAPPQQGGGSRQQNRQQGQPKSGKSPSGGQSQRSGENSESNNQGGSAQSSSAPSSAGADAQSNENSQSATQSQAQNGGGKSGPDESAPSASAAARQQRKAKQAAQALRKELQHADGNAGSRHPSARPQAFALGQSEPKQDSGLDGEQRAMLDSVPDDPGALLRRKFRLEWEQRHGGQQTEDGQQ
ncbi:MAG: VWA domain-containing protein [Rhodanobacteraceae bacterium]|nr:MAG: VWA domain-containing protein [Rhodanobacteraceae bacterium]